MKSTFDTDRLMMRPTCEEDAEFIFRLLNMPKWHQFIGDRNVNSKADAAEYIKVKMDPQLERLGFGNYTVIRKTDAMKLGTVGLYDREGLEGLDIGFAFLPDFEGQGYAYESATALIDYIRLNFGLNVINAITDKRNVSSQKLLEKLGLNFQKMTLLPGESEEVMFYSNKA